MINDLSTIDTRLEILCKGLSRLPWPQYITGTYLRMKRKVSSRSIWTHNVNTRILPGLIAIPLNNFVEDVCPLHRPKYAAGIYFIDTEW